MMKSFFVLLCAGCVLGPATGLGRVKLVALPPRELIEIRLDHPSATLIEEERILTLQQGRNQVDFSWKGVDIDVDSIRLTVLDQSEEIHLLAVSYPPAEAALVWDLHSARATEARVRISYLLSHIDQLATYRATVNQEETNARIRGFSVLRNFSGEDFDEASVQLDAFTRIEHVDLRHEETIQLARFETGPNELQKTWTFDAAQLPWDPQRVDGNVGIPFHYVIPNTQERGLGDAPLPPGRIRVFQDDGANGSIFLGEDDIPLVPVGEEMRVRIGESYDVVVTQRKLRENRVNVRRNKKNRVVLYDTDEHLTATLENFKSDPVTLRLIQHIPGQWVMHECNHEYERKDASRLLFTIELPPHSKRELNMTYSRLNIR